MAAVKERANATAFAPTEDFRRDSDLFLQAARDPETQRRMSTAMNPGFQTRDAEMDMDRMVAELAER